MVNINIKFKLYLLSDMDNYDEFNELHKKAMNKFINK